jgi:hypothetical protein
MQSATFLDIRAGADRYRFVVAAQRRAEPNPAILPQNDVADDAGVGRDPIAILGRQPRPAVVKCVNRHDGGSGEERWFLAHAAPIAYWRGIASQNADRSTLSRILQLRRKSGHKRQWSVPGEHESRGRIAKNQGATWLLSTYF